MKGNKTGEQTITLGKLKDNPKGMMIAYPSRHIEV
jgi:hypothetical protein